MTRRPDFFIVGAPKCGTTALSEYLRTHPNAFVSTPKEPFYFCSDFPGLPHPATEAEYLRLFAPAPLGASAVGEATTLYLYSERAIGALRQFAPEARILVMLRNPVDVAVAFHAQQLVDANETEESFEIAWALQEERRNGRNVPRLCLDPALLQYRAVARLGSQLERLCAIFPPNQVCILWFDDLARNPATPYRQALQFLGLPNDGRETFPTVNERRRVRSQRLSGIVNRPPLTLRRLVWRAKQRLGWERVGLLDFVRRWNTTAAPKGTLSPAFRASLVKELTDEIALLSRITGRDLRHWR